MKSSTLTSRAAWRRPVVGDFLVAEADVFGQRAGEEERILQDDGEVLAERVQIVLAQVDAVDQNLAGGDVVEAHHQAGEGGFAGAGVAYDGDRLAGLDGEGDVFQNPFDAGDGGEGGGIGLRSSGLGYA